MDDTPNDLGALGDQVECGRRAAPFRTHMARDDDGPGMTALRRDRCR
jgi:hypothetical protein